MNQRLRVEWTWNGDPSFEVSWLYVDEQARAQASDLVAALNAHPRFQARMLISEEHEVHL